MFWRKQQPLRQFYFPRQPCCGGTVQGTLRRWPVTRHGIAARPVVRAGACHSDIALTVCRCLWTPRSSWVPGVLPESAPPVPIPGVTGLALPPAGPPPPSALSSRSPHCAPHGFRGGHRGLTGAFTSGTELVEGASVLDGSPTADGDKCADGWLPPASRPPQTQKAAPRHKPQMCQSARPTRWDAWGASGGPQRRLLPNSAELSKLHRAPFLVYQLILETGRQRGRKKQKH